MTWQVVVTLPTGPAAAPRPALPPEPPPARSPVASHPAAAPAAPVSRPARNARRSRQARLTNRRHRLRPGRLRCPIGTGQGQRSQHEARLLGHPQGLPAGRQHAHIITGYEQLGAQPRGCADHMLAVIHHQQQLLPGQRPRHCLGRRNTRLLAHPQHRGHHCRTCAGSRTGANSASHAPSANRPVTRRATSPASRGLPPPPGPGHGHQPVPLQQVRDLARRSLAHEARQHSRGPMHATSRSCHPQTAERTITAARSCVQPSYMMPEAIPHRGGQQAKQSWP